MAAVQLHHVVIRHCVPEWFWDVLCLEGVHAS